MCSHLPCASPWISFPGWRLAFASREENTLRTRDDTPPHMNLVSPHAANGKRIPSMASAA